jgi:hypothetical protein
LGQLQTIHLFIKTFKGLKMTQSQALTQCLVLALTAPDDQKAEQASNLAEQLAYGLTVDQVEQCKNQALKLVGA